MQPTYGAGHATVAGACVTIIKPFFDTSAMLVRPGGAGVPVAYETTSNGHALVRFRCRVGR